jgi:hypothetical protein
MMKYLSLHADNSKQKNMEDMWFPGLGKEWNTLFLFIMRTPPTKSRIWAKSCTLYNPKYGIQDTIQVFQVWHNLFSELTSMWTFKMYSRNTKTTNEPTASKIKSDRPKLNIWDTWKTLKYLNINDSFHLKDLEISKYKRESKARMPIKFCCLIFVNCGLFSSLNIKKVNI